MNREGGFLVAKVHQTAGRVFARKLRERNIETNPALGRILYVLWEQGPMTIHELARRVALGKSTLTSALDRLELQGHVARVRSPEDRRKIVIELTPKNKALHALYQEVSIEMSRVFYEGVSEAEILQFEGTLRRVLGNLQSCEDKESGESEQA
jgi:MarR family transcriptional regulator, organic hydroperoxide resistance regulator